MIAPLTLSMSKDDLSHGGLRQAQAEREAAAFAFTLAFAGKAPI